MRSYFVGMFSGFAMIGVTGLVMEHFHPMTNSSQGRADSSPKRRVESIMSHVIDGRGASILRDAETGAEYLCYGGGIIKLEKKP